MEIKWRNVIAFVLLLGAAIAGLAMRERIAASLSRISEIGRSSDPDDRMAGLIALGFLVLLVVATARILVSGRDGGE